jgi:hypothetical protein
LASNRTWTISALIWLPARLGGAKRRWRLALVLQSGRNTEAAEPDISIIVNKRVCY